MLHGRSPPEPPDARISIAVGRTWTAALQTLYRTHHGSSVGEDELTAWNTERLDWSRQTSRTTRRWRSWSPPRTRILNPGHARTNPSSTPSTTPYSLSSPQFARLQW